MVKHRGSTAARGVRGKPDKSSERDELEARLDEALKETFPASDPVAVTPARRLRLRIERRDYG
jgi:hypothetical protein